MKKILFLLLLATVTMYGQTYQNPTFGTVTSKTNVEDNSAEKIIVQDANGKLNWIYKNSLIPDNFTKVVYVNNNNPNGATIFDLKNPPVTNDNLLKSDVNNLYIGTDASTWVYNTPTLNYVTKTVTSNTSNFYLASTSTDAGNTKTASIERNGSIQATSFMKSGATATDALLAGGSTLANPVSGSGSSGRVPFFIGTNTLSSDSGLFWDNTNKRLGVGTSTPLDRFHIENGSLRIVSGGVTSLIAHGGSVAFNGTYSNHPYGFRTNNVERGRFSSAGRLLLNTTTDNGTDQLQVNGNITAAEATTANQVVIKGQHDLKSDIASPTFTGNPTAPTPTAGDNDTSIVNSEFVTRAIETAVVTARPYKVYTALLTQTGTSAPTAIVLENTLGGAISWLYLGIGSYSTVMPMAIALSKTTVQLTNGLSNANVLRGGFRNSNEVQIVSTSDGSFTNAFIEIRVYP